VKLTSMITRRRSSLLHKLTPRRRRQSSRQLPRFAGLGLLITTFGAVAVYLFDPSKGGARRHKAIGRLSAAVRKRGRRVGKQVRYRTGQFAGVSHRVTHLGHNRDESAVDDITLTHRVESQIFRHRDTQKGQVNVSAEDGVLILRGEVDYPAEIRELTDATWKVRGVRDVRNLLHVVGTTAPNKARVLRM